MRGTLSQYQGNTVPVWGEHCPDTRGKLSQYKGNTVLVWGEYCPGMRGTLSRYEGNIVPVRGELQSTLTNLQMPPVPSPCHLHSCLGGPGKTAARKEGKQTALHNDYGYKQHYTWSWCLWLVLQPGAVIIWLVLCHLWAGDLGEGEVFGGGLGTRLIFSTRTNVLWGIYTCSLSPRLAWEWVPGWLGNETCWLTHHILRDQRVYLSVCLSDLIFRCFWADH